MCVHYSQIILSLGVAYCKLLTASLNVKCYVKFRGEGKWLKSFFFESSPPVVYILQGRIKLRQTQQYFEFIKLINLI
jgi:hypothetical protein